MSYPSLPGRNWDPFGELQALRSELARLVGGARGSFTSGIDMEQTDDGWVVTAALPGVAPEEVAVEVDGRELCIRARSEAEVNEEQGIGATGSRQRSFEYRLALPSDVDPDQVDATMDHGLLTVHLPRTTRPPRRTITIGRRGAQFEAPDPADPAADREMHHHPHAAPGSPDGSDQPT